MNKKQKLKDYGVPLQVRNPLTGDAQTHYYKNYTIAGYAQQRARLRRCNAIKLNQYDVNQLGIVSPHGSVDYDAIMRGNGNAPMFGFELEMQNRNVGGASTMGFAQAAIRQALGKTFYFAHDRSVSSGCELIAAPKTIAAWQQHYSALHKMCKALTADSWISHDTDACGLHVHVSRIALPNETWLKLQSFLARNKAPFMELSRRSGKSGTHDDPFYFCKFAKGDQKYRALNVSNANTCEFRFFRGTLLSSTLLASLEIVFSLVEFFAKESPKQKTLKAYAAFLKDSRFTLAYKYSHEVLTRNVVDAVKLTADQRKEAAALRALRKNVRNIAMQREMDTILQALERRVQLSIPNGVETTTVEATVRLTGHTAVMRTRFETEAPKIKLRVPATDADARFTVHAVRRSAWGRTSERFSVRKESDGQAWSYVAHGCY